MINQTEVATINSQLLAGMQAVLDLTDKEIWYCNKATYLEEKRTVGMVVPPKFVDYRMFLPELTNLELNKLIIVPTLDDWATIRDSFNHERLLCDKFRVFNDQGEVIDSYVLGSRAHLKLARKLKIAPSVREIVKTDYLHYVVNGVERDIPRGHCFTLQAEANGFVIKDMMARYLGRVHMFNEVSHSVIHDRPILAQLDTTEPRVEMELVVIYESRKFFDKVRKAKFYKWLATQATDKVRIILIN